ncbi:MAG: 30S ribosomal protein S8 [Nanoarchaeota archaeon]
MSQDILADTLNKVMNAKRAGHDGITVKRYSNFVLSVLALAKLKNYVASYKVADKELEIKIGSKLNACKAIKPRLIVRADEIMKYVRRYLPAKDMGVVIVSTSQGIMTHHTALEKNIGGALIAYIY